jgi:cytochrome P450
VTSNVEQPGDDVSFDPLVADPADPNMVELRDEKHVPRNDAGVWFISRFDDVLAATKNIEAFNSSFREPGVTVPDEEQFINEILEPRHGQIRRIINGAIATHKLGGVERFCTDLCTELLDRLLSRDGTVDLVGEYVMPIPSSVIANLLGAPSEDFHKWAAWSDEVVQGTYPTKYRNERGTGLAGAHPEFTEYVDHQIAVRRAEPRGDFISRLLETEVAGRRLTDVEARTQLVFLLISGNETTRHLISNLLWTIAHDAALFATLRDDRDLVLVAIEESLRRDPPIQFLMRNCIAETDVRDAHMCPHDKVAFGIASANRDTSIYVEPDSFRLDRPDPRNHLGFGGGPHVCPGSALARLEAKIAVNVFLDRVASVRTTPETSYENVPVFWAHGPRAMVVELTPA